MKAALLTPADVGDGFDADYSTGDVVDGPCPNAPAVEKVVTETARADVAITSTDASQEADQTIYRYADEASAIRAMAAMKAQVSCSSGAQTDQGETVNFTLTTVDIGSAGDERFSTKVHAEDSGSSAVLEGQVAAIRHGRYVAALTFDWDPADTPLPVNELVAKATAKLTTLS
jgi:hypothetical protein